MASGVGPQGHNKRTMVRTARGHWVFAPTIPIATCRNCGVEFRPKRKDRASFCSQACCWAEQKQAAAVRPVAVKPIPLMTRVWFHTCGGCGEAFCATAPRMSFCSPACCSRAWASARPGRKAARSCGECGVEFAPEYGNRRRLFCSPRCSTRHGKRTAKLVRKARVRGVVSEAVDPISVFERDGWRCHICRRKTPRELRGKMDDRAPELDHILPLALGGAHTYANTACACRACNMAKGATPMGQIPMFDGRPRG